MHWSRNSGLYKTGPVETVSQSTGNQSVTGLSVCSQEQEKAHLTCHVNAFFCFVEWDRYNWRKSARQALYSLPQRSRSSLSLFELATGISHMLMREGFGERLLLFGSCSICSPSPCPFSLPHVHPRGVGVSSGRLQVGLTTLTICERHFTSFGDFPIVNSVEYTPLIYIFTYLFQFNKNINKLLYIYLYVFFYLLYNNWLI